MLCTAVQIRPFIYVGRNPSMVVYTCYNSFTFSLSVIPKEKIGKPILIFIYKIHSPSSNIITSIHNGTSKVSSNIIVWIPLHICTMFLGFSLSSEDHSSISNVSVRNYTGLRFLCFCWFGGSGISR